MPKTPGSELSSPVGVPDVSHAGFHAHPPWIASSSFLMTLQNDRKHFHTVLFTFLKQWLLLIAFLISSVISGKLTHTVFQKRNSQNIALIKYINICSHICKHPSVAEIADHRNSYLFSGVGKPTFLLEKEVRDLGGRSLTACLLLPNDLSTVAASPSQAAEVA